ncbi:uncharacterized protein Dyak_GE28043 [Drosophila yakuba]|uniref:Uncharacterized protein n=1 Tax=Drosophila yakuba TaxID=7245 RepID=A0A0R1DX98_DROYA|nr:uncharacterized protein Dyak_GE28043 [Drosophila yakuba]
MWMPEVRVISFPHWIKSHALSPQKIPPIDVGLTLNNRQEGGLIHSQEPTLQIQRSFERLKVATSPRNLGTQSSS